MNLSNTITRIKLSLGLIGISLPFENIDEIITTILNEITIPTFSIFSPYNSSLYLNVNDLTILERQASHIKFLLPDFLDKKVIYLHKVTYNETDPSGMSIYYGAPFYSNGIYNSLMMANASNQMMRPIVPVLSFKFEAPRTVYLYNVIASSSLKFDLGFEHDTSLATIPESCKESFLSLAICDVKANLYPTIKHYNEINTAIGTINLKIDDWNDAINERKDLIKEWEQSYHLDFEPMYFG